MSALSNHVWSGAAGAACAVTITTIYAGGASIITASGMITSNIVLNNIEASGLVPNIIMTTAAIGMGSIAGATVAGTINGAVNIGNHAINAVKIIEHIVKDAEVIPDINPATVIIGGSITLATLFNPTVNIIEHVAEEFSPFKTVTSNPARAYNNF